ncbi:nuclear transport factor 2 family protein [Lactovum miscens]|uniref:Ketosteroid isomerase-like protein n=1 Tax=Lactovum miscens TaxID=190387 RepID=A0A841C9Y1_9LACT|nr:nuclear transport factor 2 family protein [Lactovum miscens]MBB5888392.1 ketosteroid isomerase-like protein [Lactovum miscens]
MSVGSLVTDYFEAVDSMKTNRVASFFAEDGTQRFGNSAALIGIDAIKKMYSEFFESITEIHHEVLAITTGKFLENGERRTIIMVEVSVTYIKKNNSKVILTNVVTIRMNKDKIQDFRVFGDPGHIFS